MKKTATPIRVGIVGLGRAGFGMQTQELLARPGMYEIVAGCDLSPKQRRRFGDKVPGAKLYARAEDLFADPRVELEISGGAAMKAPVYFVLGSRGALVSDDEKTLRLRYLDPKKKLPARRATTRLMDSFGRGETLPWIEETREVRKDLRPDCIWDALHGHLRGGKPFRVTTQEAFEVMRVLALASKAPVL